MAKDWSKMDGLFGTQTLKRYIDGSPIVIQAALSNSGGYKARLNSGVEIIGEIDILITLS